MTAKTKTPDFTVRRFVFVAWTGSPIKIGGFQRVAFGSALQLEFDHSDFVS